MDRSHDIPWPKFVMIEMTNACDLACRHCPFHGEGVEKLRPIGQMDGCDALPQSCRAKYEITEPGASAEKGAPSAIVSGTGTTSKLGRQ